MSLMRYCYTNFVCFFSFFTHVPATLIDYFYFYNFLTDFVTFKGELGEFQTYFRKIPLH